MAKSQMNEFIQRFHRSILLRDGAGLTDGQLLEDYLSRRDEAALAALVQQHGPMVWGVCRRVLPNYHDAEDAFQATFLVLFRKAASIASKELLANWLYGVAYQTALKARATAAKRCARERQVTEMPDPVVAEQDPGRDLQPLLDEELGRLPDKYRTVIVLCDLEGKTRKEVARQLNVPEGTVASRMATARRLLAKRLTRHGLAVSGGALAAVLTEKVAAGVPTLVFSSTIKAVSLVAAEQAAAMGAISLIRIATLTEGMLKAMLKLRTATAAMLLMALVGVGVANLLYRTQAGEPPKVTDEKNEKPLAQEGGRTKVEQKPIVVAQDAAVSRLVWSSDGRTVTTVGNAIDKYAIKVWDAKTGELKQSLGEEKNRHISALAVSPDGKTAAIAAGDLIQPTRQVRLLDTKKWHQQDVLDTDGVTALAFSPDGKKLAIVGSTVNRSFLKLWDLEKKDWIPVKEDGKWWGGPVSCLAFSPDGKVLAVGDRDANIMFFEGEVRKLKYISADHRRMIWSITFSPDSKTFVSTSLDNMVDVWDVETRKLLRRLDGNLGFGSTAAFTPDGKYLVTAGRVINNGKKSVNLSLWDAKTGKLERSIPGLTHSVYALAFSPDGKTLAIGTGDLVGGIGKTIGELRFIPLESLIAEQK